MFPAGNFGKQAFSQIQHTKGGKAIRNSKGFTGLVLLLAVGLSVWLAAVHWDRQAKEVVIGFSGPLSGVAAEYGQDCSNGVDMAIKEINTAARHHCWSRKCVFKLVKLDDRFVSHPSSQQLAKVAG